MDDYRRWGAAAIALVVAGLALYYWSVVPLKAADWINFGTDIAAISCFLMSGRALRRREQNFQVPGFFWITGMVVWVLPWITVTHPRLS